MIKKLFLLVLAPTLALSITWSEHISMALQDSLVNAVISGSESSVNSTLEKLLELLEEWNTNEDGKQEIKDKKYYEDMIELEKQTTATQVKIIDLLKQSTLLDEKLIEIEAK